MTNAKSPWSTESLIAPPLDHVPVTPTPRKYVRRGLKRAALAGVSAAATISVIALFPFAIVAIVVLGAFWWLFCLLFAR